MNDTYTVATIFLGKYHGVRREEQGHRAFLNLFLKWELCEAVIFFCAQETGGGVATRRVGIR